MALARRAISRVCDSSSSSTSRNGRLRRRSGTAGPGAGGGGGQKAFCRAWSRRLYTHGAVVRLSQLLHGCPHCGGRAMLGKVVLDQPETEIIAGALGEHLA